MVPCDNIKINKAEIYRIGGECKYEVFRSNKLGTGRYSCVYLGRCLNIEKMQKINRKDGFVAIKKINMYGISYDSNKMLLNEIMIIKKMIQFGHTNIVKYYDVIEDIDTAYVIMEYCDGGNLEKLLGKPLKLEFIKCYFGQLMNALYFLHTFDIIHRDLKPSNILLMDGGKTLKICDFGFAKVSTGLKKVNTICGSPLYMAPELLNKKNYDSSCDVWALGMILFEMMYGYHPCDKCKDIDELILYVTDNKIKIPSIGQINDTLNDEIIDLVTKMLDSDDTKRITLDDLFKHSFVCDAIDIKSVTKISDPIAIKQTIVKSVSTECSKSMPIMQVSDKKTDIENIKGTSFSYKDDPYVFLPFDNIADNIYCSPESSGIDLITDQSGSSSSIMFQMDL